MKKKGISLILLVITIIIIIIIASAVILNLNQNNPVDKARLANVQQTRDSLKSGINLYMAKIMVKENGNHNASTMLLGKNSLVVNYSIVIDYSIYRTIRGDLNIWELDYDEVKNKVNIKLDVYDSNSRWYIDEYGNPYLVYNSLENVSPYLKTEDGSAILASVSDFVVIPGDNQEFAYKGEFYQAKKSRTNVVNSLNTYLANAKSAVSTASIKSIVLGSDSATSSYAIAEDNNQSNAQITLNGEETTLYKINTANFASKVGVSLPSYNSANWYIDENGNTYLIFDENVTIPESLSSSVYSSSYVTNEGGTITGNSSVVINNNSNNNQSGSNQPQNTTYTITYDTDGGSSVNDQTKNEGETITLAAAPIKNGFEFRYWIDESQNTYAAEDEYSADSNLSLTAVWKSENDFTASDFSSLNAQQKYNNVLGKTVTNYTSVNGWEDWQIFYADDDNIYLIAKGMVPVSYLGSNTVFETSGDYGVRSSVSRDDLIQKLSDTDNFSGFLDEDGKALESRIPNIEEFCASYNSVSNKHNGTTFATFTSMPCIQTLSFEYIGQYTGYSVSGDPSYTDGNTVCSMPYNELNSLWIMSQSNNAPYSSYEGYWLSSAYAFTGGPYHILLVSNRMGAIFSCHFEDGFYSYSMRY